MPGWALIVHPLLAQRPEDEAYIPQSKCSGKSQSTPLNDRVVFGMVEAKTLKSTRNTVREMSEEKREASQVPDDRYRIFKQLYGFVEWFKTGVVQVAAPLEREVCQMQNHAGQ